MKVYLIITTDSYLDDYGNAVAITDHCAAGVFLNKKDAVEQAARLMEEAKALLSGYSETDDDVVVDTDEDHEHWVLSLNSWDERTIEIKLQEEEVIGS